jgi:integrase
LGFVCLLFTVKDQTKTEGSRGSVPIPPELAGHLRSYIRKEKIEDLLFGTRIGTAMGPDNYLDRELKELGVLAGIDVITKGDGKITSKLNHQVLRRTTATHFQKHGNVKDAQALLRHAEVTTILKHYQKALDASLVSGVASWDHELTRKSPGSARKRVVEIHEQSRRIAK